VRRVYFAHPIWLYGTKIQVEGINLIKKSFGDEIEIVNPADYESDPELRRRKRLEGMNFCFKLIDRTDFLVFRRFPFPLQIQVN
jgi:hypothetical protein